MSKPIISVSGLRGIVGESLSPVLVMQYVAAFAANLPEGPVVVTRDGRSSGSMLAEAVQSALMAMGRDVLYGDVAATPTTGVLVRDQQAAGAVQISASHNPPQYNGIKLFASDGRVIGAAAGQQVIDTMDREPAWVGSQQVGSRTRIADTISHHLDLVLDTVDVELIRSRNYTVVLDSNHGAGSLLGVRMLHDLNTNLFVLGETPDGQFDHPPEPTAANLEHVATTAVPRKADVVFCQDPDADRLAIIDAGGNYIGEEYTLALTLKRRLMQQAGDCVINCATSRMSLDVAAEFNCHCHLSAVGEANVCDLMQSVDAVYGGEGNGGPIDPRVGYVRDSFVAMAQVLELMASSKQSISELVAGLPSYAIRKATSQVDREKLPAVYEALQEKFRDASVSLLDGLRFDWPESWLLVRPSNTEPLVRIICETRSRQDSDRLVSETMAVINSV
jgi:phosphomannomutase